MHATEFFSPIFVLFFSYIFSYTYALDCFGGSIYHTATMIFRTTKVSWIRFTHFFFTASNRFLLQPFFKSLHKKPILIYLKWTHQNIALGCKLSKLTCGLNTKKWIELQIRTIKKIVIFSHRCLIYVFMRLKTNHNLLTY